MSAFNVDASTKNVAPATPLQQSGLTLLEVMVALLIFALTGTAVLKAAGEHLSSVGQIESVTFANWVASNRLNQLQLDTTWPPKNNLKGTMEMADRTWYWQQTVTKTNDNDLRSVTVSVGEDESYGSSVTSVTTFVAKPTAEN
ncbi:type II secretion system protein GspI [Alteromonas sp. KUL17]|uniref:type II secretion system minor pseudopilin GspI n=1 Tax=Alteromonas sp. KUL17 TaxID=2480796 RepID=UPI0010376660|nr:type II secretion system minor pseudopilin GspI [Alteromonas sp. KUL17]TAP22350.1 type II secretion system protein GspI [Alteromonas sp. KUL17]GEA04622.1 type II secretion system protein GspI [Alteromonas sp. KUL17]